jgi:hypothetical protein
MRNRSHGFRLCIAAAVAVAVIAAPAASAGVHKYDTHLSITTDRASWYHGTVFSRVKKCKEGRRVIVSEERPGADRRIGTARSSDRGGWALRPGQGPPRNHHRVYAKVKRKVLQDGDVCRAARSQTI